MQEKPTRYSMSVTVNGLGITTVLIGRHYLKKHANYMNDEVILELVAALDGHSFPVDSEIDGIEYYAADVRSEATGKTFRIIWLFEGTKMEVLGVINAYRRSKGGKNEGTEK